MNHSSQQQGNKRARTSSFVAEIWEGGLPDERPMEFERSNKAWLQSSLGQQRQQQQGQDGSALDESWA